MNPTIKALASALIGSYARMILIWTAGILAGYAGLSHEQTDAAMKPILEPGTAALGSLVLAGVAGGWKVIAHLRYQRLIELALAVTAGTSRAEFERKITADKKLS